MDRTRPCERAPRRAAILCILPIAVWLAGCATGSEPVPPFSSAPSGVVDESVVGVAERAAQSALEMVGKPYRYGGDSPAGFDCSGLVRYAYAAAGMDLPRDTLAQRAQGTSVPAAQLRPGDLLFFVQRGKDYSHVGIYLGDGRFVHAPSSGKSVRTDSLDQAYWTRHFLEARRL